MKKTAAVILRLIRKSVRKPVAMMGRLLNELTHRGKDRYCPVCGRWYKRFLEFGNPVRQDAQCIHCESLERHRLFWLFLQRKTDLLEGGARRMLHVAPEPCFEPRFKKLLGDNYVTADLLDPRAMVKMDIMDIQYPDQSFDVIYCSHVLEHVQDDKQAMREFFRVLKNDGWAVLLVPISCDKTFEDPAIVDPEERRKAFGQEDHVRRYGPDYVERLREAGFNVEVFNRGDLVDNNEIALMRLTPGSGSIFFCTKPPTH